MKFVCFIVTSRQDTLTLWGTALALELNGFRLPLG